MSRLFSWRTRPHPTQSREAKLPISVLRQRVRRLQGIVFSGLVLFVLVYEFGISQWIEIEFGTGYHVMADILIYGIVGPLSTYLMLHFLDRWLEERETSELQSKLLAQARQKAADSTTLSDDALQTLFAASVLISSLKSNHPDLSPEAKADLARTEESLDRAITQIREHLEQ